MTKFKLLSVLYLLFLVACNSVTIEFDLEKEKAQDLSRSRSGLMTASLTSSAGNYNVGIRIASVVANDIKETITSIVPVVTRERSVLPPDTLLFFVNFDDGWVVISGDKRTEPILARSSSGSIDPYNIDNPGVALWFADVENAIKSIKTNSVRTRSVDNNISEQWIYYETQLAFQKAQTEDALSTNPNGAARIKLPPRGDENGTYYLMQKHISSSSTEEVTHTLNHLIQTKWDQGSPWNSNCPAYEGESKCPTGCVATAMAQMLYYLHYKIGKPTGLWHTAKWHGNIYQSISMERSNYVDNSDRWNMMPYYGYDETEYTDYVASFMADIGYRVNMSYGSDASGAQHNTYVPTFRSFGINSSSLINYDANAVIQQLDAGFPVFIRADASVGGHAWIIDGYKTRKTTTYYNYVWETIYVPENYVYPGYPYVGWPLTLEEATAQGVRHGTRETNVRHTYQDNVLMNWGWGGRYDNVEYDSFTSTIWRAGEYDFYGNKKIITNFN